MTTQEDVMEKLGRSLIQHGKYNDRIYLMKLDVRDLPDIVGKMEDLARQEDYSKICVKVPAEAEELFAAAGYGVEARVPGFYRGEQDGVFLGRFLKPERSEAPAPQRSAEVLEEAHARAGEGLGGPWPEEFEFRQLAEVDIPEMVGVFETVFETYPFPIHDPDYIRDGMATDVLYYAAMSEGKIAAISSAEMDPKALNAEMTDFATMPDQRGNSLAVHLLDRMDDEIAARGIKTAYTIARSVSFGMNITFAKLHYLYAGTLINNTNICGRFESMNIWYKPL